MGKSVRAEEVISARFGKKGTKEREKFREEAFSYYFGEIIRKRPKGSWENPLAGIAIRVKAVFQSEKEVCQNPVGVNDFFGNPMDEIGRAAAQGVKTRL